MYVSDAVLWFDPLFFVHLQFHGAPWYFTEILSYFNWVFTLLFTVECAFKLLSFGPKVSRKSRKGFFFVLSSSHEFWYTVSQFGWGKKLVFF